MTEKTFQPFPGTDAEMFIQWKGTDVCLDFYCPCGVQGHLDGFFAYNVKCSGCGTFYELGTQVRAIKLDGEPSGQVRELIGDQDRPTSFLEILQQRNVLGISRYLSFPVDNPAQPDEQRTGDEQGDGADHRGHHHHD